jgi:hypothetical protein
MKVSLQDERLSALFWKAELRGLEAVDQGDGLWLVSSFTTPGHWYEVLISKTDAECNCVYMGACSHIAKAASEEFYLLWLEWFYDQKVRRFTERARVRSDKKFRARYLKKLGVAPSWEAGLDEDERKQTKLDMSWLNS